MSTGMRTWMEKDCPDIPALPAEVSIGREELRQLRDELAQYKSERDNANAAAGGVALQAEKLQEENDELRKALAQKVTSETLLRYLSVGNGPINASFEGGAVQLLVDSLATQFVESGAPNYTEMQFHSEATGPLLLTLQRVNGATPHELRAKAEKERDDLLARIEEMEKQEPFDANSDVFRGAFAAALKAGNWPMTRQGDGYRSPSTQIAWRIAFSTVSRMKLYLAPGAKGEEK